MNNNIIFLLIFIILQIRNIAAQNVGISSFASTPDASAMLDIVSTSKGMLIPRMTEAQRDAISSPATSLFVYQLDNFSGYYYWNGSKWIRLFTFEDNDSDWNAGTLGRTGGFRDCIYNASAEEVVIGSTTILHKTPAEAAALEVVKAFTPASSIEIVAISNETSTLTIGQNSLLAFYPSVNFQHTNVQIGASYNGSRSDFIVRSKDSWDSELERLRISSWGNVGISTQDPDAKLEISNKHVSSHPSGQSYSQPVVLISNETGDASDARDPRIAFRTGISPVYRFTMGVDDSDADKFKISRGNGLSMPDFTIDGSGNIGIGTFTPSHKFEVSNDDAAKLTTNTWTTTSDERLKKNVIPFNDGLETVLKINPVCYEYNGLANTPDGYKGIGVIAQDIEKVAPYTIRKFNRKLSQGDLQETELYGFNSHALTFVLINAIKEQQQILENLNGEKESIREEIQRLNTSLTLIEGYLKTKHHP